MSSVAVATVDEPVVQQVAKPAGKRKLILIVAAVVLMGLIGAALWLSGVLHHRASGADRLALASVVEKPVLIDIPDIVTNLDNGSRRAVFIKLKARIELAHASDQANIAANMPRIMDAFQTYLRSLSPEELHGGEGVYRLREALMSRINVISSPVQVLDLLFVEMLIQ